MAEDKRYSRQTLKSYFRSGNVPKEEHFAALIDSMYNFVDDDKPEEVMPVPEPVIEEPEEEKREPVSAQDTSVTDGTVNADGIWHDLPVSDRWKDRVSGCCMFHIIAGYRTNHGTYRLSEATVSLCEGRRPKLSSPQKSGWGFWKSPVRFRWTRYGSRLFLQIKGKRKKYGESILHYRIQELWSYTETSSGR
ncbi:hypothetical protein J8873_23290 [Phocaeicola dorei]|jgi:hypothetical protein|uniref:hypothetical protein n=1 Tax=Phocaeicola dorei TaxID=357276 RepID=UPI00033E1012|nr:hypothetical protein [Phocaeicola dorei]MCE8447143.1 hypothetical protein [Phocaeicola dorei]CDB38224.1 putative uncharacterized protein [Phocaeicola dorei CAG:222]